MILATSRVDIAVLHNSRYLRLRSMSVVAIVCDLSHCLLISLDRAALIVISLFLSHFQRHGYARLSPSHRDFRCIDSNNLLCNRTL